jgi:FkbM family methyltransferase
MDINQEIIQIPGTSFWTIAKDTHQTPSMIKNRSIITKRNKRMLDWVNKLFPDSFGKNKVAIDVGAYIGDTVTILLRYGCTVIAFEPQFIAFECLKKNCPEAQLFNNAIGEKGQKVEEWFNDWKPGNIAGLQYKLSEKGMNIITLDDFLYLEKCDFVKIDVQGMEPYVLNGGRKFFEKFKPIMLVEFYDPCLKRRIINGKQFSCESLQKMIENMGYEEAFKFKYDILFKPK